MITEYIKYLNKKKIVLASGSDRRQRILQDVGLEFIRIPSSYDENLNLDDFKSLNEYCIEAARCKSLNVWNHCCSSNIKADLIVGADTVICFQGDIFLKPKNEEEAISMLEKYSGKFHKVITGVALLLVDYFKSELTFEVTTFYEETEVKFCDLTPEMIKAYVNNGEGMDKAGGYAIQGLGGTFVEKINGDYFNCVGFPIHRFCREVYNLIQQKKITLHCA